MKDKFVKAHMRAAYVYASLSSCERRQVGCVIVKHNSIIAIGYNGTPAGECNKCEDENGITRPDVIHAEDNALQKLMPSPTSSKGASMFVTTAPCKGCAVRIVNAKIKRVYYDDVYRNENGLDYLRRKGIEVIKVNL